MMGNALQVLEFDPKRVKPFVRNPRKRFRGIPQLAESIRTVGQVTPIIVAPCEENGYDAELVDGERRLRACLHAKMPVAAVLAEDGDVASRYVRSVAANFCRQGHDAVEIMEAVIALREAGWSKQEIAAIFGKTESWVQQYTILRKLAPEVLEKLKIAGDGAKQSRAQKRGRGRLTLSVALLLAPLPPELQVKGMRGIVAGKMSMAEARTYIHKLAASKGRRVGVRMSDRDRFRAISTAVANCYHVAERYLTMPGAEINSLVRGARPDERKRVSHQLESLCESLLLLADEIHKGEGRR